MDDKWSYARFEFSEKSFDREEGLAFRGAARRRKRKRQQG